MTDIITDILNAKDTAWYVACTLALAAATLVMSTSELIWLTTIAAGFSFFGALSGVYALDQAGINLASDKDAHIVLSATLGMVVGMVLCLAFVRAIYTVSEWMKPSPKTGPVKL